MEQNEAYLFRGSLIQSAFLKLGCSRYWDRIGPFLRFLFESRFLAQDYSKLILHRRSHTPHPTVYSTEEISVVEDSVDRNSPSGIRNFAIILLLSRYGIRACDIAALSFENIDFQNNRIHFTQQKTGDPWESELFPEVKAALQNYIQNVRPHVPGCSQIFITLTHDEKGNAILTLTGKGEKTRRVKITADATRLLNQYIN